jgi:probable phosphoglycerate mutase
MTIYFIRHGETDLNRQGIVQGSGIDSELNAKGRKQAWLFYEYYKNVQFDALVTSALKRTHQTIEPFLKQNIQHFKTPLINEISWGIHEGQPRAEWMTQQHTKMIAAWESGDASARIEGGESLHELAERILKFIDMLKTMPYNNVLVCTHGRTLVAMMAILQGKPLGESTRFKHNNTCLYKVHYLDGEFMFEIENDTRHLGQFSGNH